MANNTLQYEERLDSITGIEVDAEQINLNFVTGGVTDLVRLEAEAVPNAPRLERSGSTLRIEQEGRYRSRKPAVVSLPAGREIAIAANLGRGDLSLASVEGPLAINLAKGDLAIESGSGDIALNVSNGDVAIIDREGEISGRLALGDFALQQCRGELSIDVSRGDVSAADCAGQLNVRMAKGDVSIVRPIELEVNIRNSSGDVMLSEGSVRALRVKVASGDIVSRTRLLYTGDEEVAEDIGIETEPAEDFEDEVPGGIDIGEHGVRINLGGMRFRAGDDGVRIMRGGHEVFRAGPEGLEVRGRDGKEIFVASSEGMSWAGKDFDSQYTLETSRGDIMLDIPDDQAARVELLIHSGSVNSDIPLVEVGRPGPRGATRRYVGVSDGGERERILVSARTQRGDISVLHRAVRDRHRRATGKPRRSKEEQRKSILEALAQGKLTVDEAQVLIAAIERER